MHLPCISIIIPNWNGARYLIECLESLLNQTFKDFEVILVDNGSTDGSLDSVKAKFPLVKPIYLGKNYGFAKAVNIGIRQALKNNHIKYIALLNNDTQLDPRWLEELNRAMESDNSIGFCASKVLFLDRENIINSVGDIYKKSGFPNHRGVWQEDEGQFETRQEVFGASACAAIYRRQLFMDIGLFDEDFFAYCEDVDLSFRAQLRGYRCIYVPKAIVYHKGWATGGIMADYYNARNRIYCLLKNMPGHLLIRYLPFVISAQVYLLYDKRKNLKSVLKGQFDGLCSAFKAFKKRRAIQKAKRVSLGYLVSLFS